MKKIMKRGSTMGKKDQGLVIINTQQSICIQGITPNSAQRGFEDKVTNFANIDELGETFLQQYSIGYACKKGLKPESPNQDDFCIALEGDTLVLAVFDGHGQYGHDVSNFIHTFLPTVILQDPDFSNNIEKSIKKAFTMAQTAIVIEADLPGTEWDCALSGTTATIAIIRGTTVHVAHVGDSRAILGITHETTPPTALPLTPDHKPTDKDEKKRILKAGGEVRQDSDDPFPRIFKRGEMYPGINMSRSIGDIFAQTLGVSCEPTIKNFTLENDQKFMIIASDGIWEFITNIEVVRAVHKHGKEGVQQAAVELSELAWKRWIANEEDLVDDITIIIHYFS